MEQKFQMYLNLRGRPWQIKAVGPDFGAKAAWGAVFGSLGFCLPAARFCLRGCSLCAGGFSGVCQRWEAFIKGDGAGVRRPHAGLSQSGYSAKISSFIDSLLKIGMRFLRKIWTSCPKNSWRPLASEEFAVSLWPQRKQICSWASGEPIQYVTLSSLLPVLLAQSFDLFTKSPQVHPLSNSSTI